MDDEVASQVLGIVREARKNVIIVTPYLKLWVHAKEAIALAVKRRVDVAVITRLEPGILESEDVIWLKNNGVKVLVAPYLHAKIYMNEQAIVVSSMNLTEFSTKNSLEIALVVREDRGQRQIRDYVANTLMALGTPVNNARVEPTQQPATRPAQPGQRGHMGVCIRCRRPIVLDPARPLCPACYESWAQWGNADYPEVFCHACGNPSDVTYDRPLCRDCFRRQR